MVIAAALMAMFFGLAGPASANTGLGGYRDVPCAGDMSNGCLFFSDSHGNFLIVASTCTNGIDNNTWNCKAGHGYLHKTDSTGQHWAWRVWDDWCDNKGTYYSDRSSPGCNDTVGFGAAVTGSMSSFHVNWGGASPGGLTYNVPTVVDAGLGNSGWTCPITDPALKDWCNRDYHG